MQVSIFQGDAIFSSGRGRALGKDWRKPGCPKTGCARALEMPKGKSRTSSKDQNQSLAAVRKKKKKKKKE